METLLRHYFSLILSEKIQDFFVPRRLVELSSLGGKSKYLIWLGVIFDPVFKFKFP